MDGSNSTTWASRWRRACTCTTRCLMSGVFGRLDLDYLGFAVAAFESLHNSLFVERRRRPARPRLLGRRGGGVRVPAPRTVWLAASSAGSSSTTRASRLRRSCTCTTLCLVSGVFGRLYLDYLGVAAAAFVYLHHALFGGRRLWPARPRLLGRRGGGVRVLAPHAFLRAASLAGCDQAASMLFLLGVAGLRELLPRLVVAKGTDALLARRGRAARAAASSCCDQAASMLFLLGVAGRRVRV